MKILNIKANVNKQEKDYYFHNTYRYNYAIKPGYGRNTHSDKESRGFKYPEGRDFLSYDKTFLPINQNKNHWTLCFMDVRH